MRTEEIREQLRERGEARLQARARAAEESKVIAELVREGFGLGLIQAELVRLSGLSRTAVEAIVKGGD